MSFDWDFPFPLELKRGYKVIPFWTRGNEETGNWVAGEDGDSDVGRGVWYTYVTSFAFVVVGRCVCPFFPYQGLLSEPSTGIAQPQSLIQYGQDQNRVSSLVTARIHSLYLK